MTTESPDRSSGSRQQGSRCVSARSPGVLAAAQGRHAPCGEPKDGRLSVEVCRLTQELDPDTPIGVALAEIAEIHFGLHPMGETAKRRTGRSFGSKATASSVRQAPPSSAQRKKPAIGDSSAETAETAQTAGSMKSCSNIRRLGGRRRTGSRIAQTCPNCRNPFRARSLLIGITLAETAETPVDCTPWVRQQDDGPVCCAQSCGERPEASSACGRRPAQRWAS